MKKSNHFIVAALICLSTICNFQLQAQNVNIPDANFKAYLLGNSGINTNADGEIQTSEAVAYTGGIYAGTQSISNLTGIEAFINITGLDVSQNSLTTIDLSSNTALTNLYCYFNSITYLNLSSNTALTYVDCSDNQLTSLNIKNGNNTNLISFSAINNSGLTCILVDNAVYMNSNWPSAKDAGASYNDVSCCSIVVDAGTDQTVCGSIGYATLNGSVSGNTTTGLWQTSGDGSFSPNNTTLSANYNFGPADIASGTTVLTLISTNNGACSPIQDDMILTIDVTSTFSGTINCAGFPADSVMVFLYEVTQTGNYVKKDSVETDVSGYYQFTLLPEGKYVAKAVPSLTRYPNYLPTYFLSTTGTTYWDQAFVDSLYCGVNPLAHNIPLIQKVPQIGAWQCNGYIYEYYGFGARLAGNIQGIMAPGEPIPDIDITIDQSPGGTISSATTDVNGYFAFTGLNNNVTFVVRVDLPGYPNDSVYTFTVTPGDPALDSLNFYIDSVGVYIIPEGITSVNLITLEDYNINIVPNPTTQNFVMEITSTKHIKINVSLTNSLGQVVLSNQSNLNIGLNKVNFDIQNQPPGVYFMSINYENNHFIKKIIKQ